MKTRLWFALFILTLVAGCASPNGIDDKEGRLKAGESTKISLGMPKLEVITDWVHEQICHSQRALELFEGPQEMVAGSDRCVFTDAWCGLGGGKRLRASSLYLQPLLIALVALKPSHCGGTGDCWRSQR